MNLVANKNYHY